MRKHICLLIVSLACCWAHPAAAQSTIFTYQGRLAVNGSPANGFYDFQFTVYKVETNGLIIAGPQTNAAVAVSGGLFTTSLDFGNQPFLGVNRFMDIAVRTNGSATGFSSLAPRIRIASAPYAIAAANVIDGAVPSAALSPGPGADGQVLKMQNGVLTWANFGTGGTVTSVAAGPGLLGGPITVSGTLSIDPTVVPLLNGNQTFSGHNTFNGASSFTNANNRFTGAFTGNGANLTTLGAGNISSGTLSDTRLSANVPLLSGNQTFTGSNTFNGAGSFTNANNRFTGVFTGNGANLTTLGAGNISSGTLSDARLSANVPLLSGNQTFAGSNTFNGVSSLLNANNRFAGAFIGDGSGLTNITTSSTNVSVTLGGDVTGPANSNTVARIRAINVSATPPTTGQLLRYNGTAWTPGPVALGSDVRSEERRVGKGRRCW